ncbi:hypothetical protein K505DRAFT_358260 [Melanomma pulvis-pyrius CBS 109.77]|uniref:Uncharacterized protein n=1 Tax=Melanomma pulvis-pyrius CBS 109.77 TaxID=1314802 RepID=A0A6A6XMT3_9PLEO|nr:hypothetical protein K505DRAFT_358260 [Melanomma pulvis-pyrius CBS 109.77]
MASADDLTTFNNMLSASRRRSSSISPSDSPSPGRPMRRSIFGTFAENVDNYSDVASSHPSRTRRKSFAGFFRKPLRGEGCSKMSNDGNSRHDQFEDTLSSSSPGEITPPSDHESGRRRSSRFSSISSVGSAIRKGLNKIARRKDSTLSDTCPTTLAGCGVGLAGAQDEFRQKREDVYHYTTTLEPLAQAGLLRFENMSVDDLLHSPAGPSTYYSTARYLHRECALQKSTPYSYRPRGDAINWILDNPRIPTPFTNAEAGADPYQWHRLSGHSPGPVARRARPSRRYSIQQLPNFLRTKPRGGRRKGKVSTSSSNGSSHGAAKKRGASCAPPVTSSTFPIFKPNVFRPVSDLQLSFNSNDIGVLPTIDSASIDNAFEVPRATYNTDSPTSSMVPLHKVPTINNPNADTSSSSSDQSLQHTPPSCNSSLGPLRPSPPSSTIVLPPPSMTPIPLPSSIPATPFILPSTPLPQLPTPILLPPIHPLSTRNLIYTHSAPNLLPVSGVTSSPANSIGTAADSLSSRSELHLRRTYNLSNTLEHIGVEEDERFKHELDGERGCCSRNCKGVACCWTRGRSRTRRGDM